MTMSSGRMNEKKCRDGRIAPAETLHRINGSDSLDESCSATRDAGSCEAHKKMASAK